MKVIVALATILLGACGSGIIGPDLDTTNRRLLYPIPPEYAGWYAEVESCLDRVGNFDIIIWHVADRIEFDGLTAPGIWQEPHTIIILGIYVVNVSIVKHDMVHHVLQGGSTHDTAVFDCAHG